MFRGRISGFLDSDGFDLFSACLGLEFANFAVLSLDCGDLCCFGTLGELLGYLVLGQDIISAILVF